MKDGINANDLLKSIIDEVYIILFAGGSGTRLFPLSVEGINTIEDCPKQFIKLFEDPNGNEESLLQSSYRKFKKIGISDDHFVIATRKNWIDKIFETLPQIPLTNIIGEPINKDTGPAHVLSAKITTQIAKQKYGDNMDPILINVYVDNYIDSDSEDLYLKTQIFAAVLAKKEKKFIAVGIDHKSDPNINYGYIKLKDNSVMEHEIVYSSVESFIEKPILPDAKRFVSGKEGKYLWNAGQYVTLASTFKKLALECDDILLTKHIYKNTTKAISKTIYSDDYNDDQYFDILKYPVDKYISENMADEMLCVIGNYSWTDVGTWNAIYEILKKQDKADAAGNIIMGHTKEIDCLSCTKNSKNNLVYCHTKPIVLNGINNSVIIDTKDILLVGNLDDSTNLKCLVEQFQHKNKQVLQKKLFY